MSVVVVILAFASAGVVGADKPIVVKTAGSVPGARPTEKPSGVIVKAKKANVPIGWQKIVGDTVKNHLIKKTWMIKLLHRRYPGVRLLQNLANGPVTGIISVIFAGPSALS